MHLLFEFSCNCIELLLVIRVFFFFMPITALRTANRCHCHCRALIYVASCPRASWIARKRREKKIEKKMSLRNLNASSILHLGVLLLRLDFFLLLFACSKNHMLPTVLLGFFCYSIESLSHSTNFQLYRELISLSFFHNDKHFYRIPFELFVRQ